MNATVTEWEAAWTNYIDALKASDDTPCGEDFVYWCGVNARRLNEAKRALRVIDPAFCMTHGI
jgi:hypothetical protein